MTQISIFHEDDGSDDDLRHHSRDSGREGRGNVKSILGTRGMRIPCHGIPTSIFFPSLLLLRLNQISVPESITMRLLTSLILILILILETAQACMHYKATFPFNPTLPFEASIADNEITTCCELSSLLFYQVRALILGNRDLNHVCGT